MTRRAGLVLGLLAALVAAFFAPSAAARELWLVEPTAVLRIDTDRSEVQSTELQGGVRAIAPVRTGGAWLLMDDALVLLDAALVERARVALPTQHGGETALATQPDDGSA